MARIHRFGIGLWSYGSPAKGRIWLALQPRFGAEVLAVAEIVSSFV